METSCLPAQRPRSRSRRFGHRSSLEQKFWSCGKRYAVSPFTKCASELAKDNTDESEALALDDLRRKIDLLIAQAECDMKRKITDVYLRAHERDVGYSELRELVDQPFFERVRQSGWSKACDFIVDLLEFERPRFCWK